MTTSGVRVFLLKSQIHNQFTGSKPQQSSLRRCRRQVSFTIRLEKSLFRVQKSRCVQFTVQFPSLSEERLRSEQSDGFQLIPNVCLRQYPDNVKLSSRDRQEYTGHEILQVLQQRRTRDRRNPRWLLASHFPLRWSFSRFWSNFIETEVLKEKEYSILRILYCYNLQKHIFLAF